MLTKEERSAINKRNRSKGRKIVFTGFPVGMIVKHTLEYKRLHTQISRVRGEAWKLLCAACGNQANEWAYIHNTDIWDIYNYVPKCLVCHRNYDRVESTQAKGEDLPQSKITEDDVREIRRLYKETSMTQKEIGKLFGIKDNTTSLIINRKTWNHVK